VLSVKLVSFSESIHLATDTRWTSVEVIEAALAGFEVERGGELRALLGEGSAVTED